MACLWTKYYPCLQCNARTLYWVHVLNHTLLFILLLPQFLKIPITNTSSVSDSKSTIYFTNYIFICFIIRASSGIYSQSSVKTFSC